MSKKIVSLEDVLSESDAALQQEANDTVPAVQSKEEIVTEIAKHIDGMCIVCNSITIF